MNIIYIFFIHVDFISNSYVYNEKYTRGWKIEHLNIIRTILNASIVVIPNAPESRYYGLLDEKSS